MGLTEEEWERIDEAAVGIATLRRELGHLCPVMLLDVTERMVYAYSAAEFGRTLSRRDQVLLDERLRRPEETDGIVLFLRDSVRRTLRSLILDRPGPLDGSE